MQKVMSKSDTTADWSIDFVQGFACAAGQLARHGHHTLARDLMTWNGLTLRDLADAEVESFDFDPIRRAMQ